MTAPSRRRSWSARSSPRAAAAVRPSTPTRSNHFGSSDLFPMTDPSSPLMSTAVRPRQCLTYRVRSPPASLTGTPAVGYHARSACCCPGAPAAAPRSATDQEPPVTRTPRRELLALLKTARESADDRTPRLIVADWLEDHGDEVDRARAEYMRLGDLHPGRCSPATHARQSELLQQHRDTWLGPLLGLSGGRGLFFEDGLPTVQVSGRDLVGKKVAAVQDREEWAWVGKLCVKVDAGSAAAVAAS